MVFTFRDYAVPRQLPSTKETYFLPKRLLYDTMSLLTTISLETVSYLKAPAEGSDHLTVLANFEKGLLTKVAPVRTTGDGNCLLHALSRALWGEEWYHEILRKFVVYDLLCLLCLRMLQTELKENEDFYKHAVDKPADSKPDPNGKDKDEEFCYTDDDYKVCA